jgi:hypothetical protein
VIARTRIAAVLAATLALAACTGGGSSKQFTNVVPPSGNPGSVAPASKLSIAGVGDSLTAGVQSGGLMGFDLPVLGVNPQLGQIGPVQRTQEHGFFALLWEQANGVDINTMSDPSVSPLPLLKPRPLRTATSSRRRSRATATRRRSRRTNSAPRFRCARTPASIRGTSQFPGRRCTRRCS